MASLRTIAVLNLYDRLLDLAQLHKVAAEADDDGNMAQTQEAMTIVLEQMEAILPGIAQVLHDFLLEGKRKKLN